MHELVQQLAVPVTVRESARRKEHVGALPMRLSGLVQHTLLPQKWCPRGVVPRARSAADCGSIIGAVAAPASGDQAADGKKSNGKM